VGAALGRHHDGHGGAVAALGLRQVGAPAPILCWLALALPETPTPTVALPLIDWSLLW
jgi:hypothetical protein